MGIWDTKLKRHKKNVVAGCRQASFRDTETPTIEKRGASAATVFEGGMLCEGECVRAASGVEHCKKDDRSRELVVICEARGDALATRMNRYCVHQRLGCRWAKRKHAGEVARALGETR